MISGGARGSKPIDEEALTAKMLDQLLTFDQDKSGRLEASEIAALTKVLDQLNGGFGRMPAVPMDLDRCKQRLIASYGSDKKHGIAANALPERMGRLTVEGDTNKDGFLSEQEIELYVRKTAFQRRMWEGIYVGGGFSDTYLETAYVLDQMEMPTALRDKTRELLAVHSKRLDVLTQEGIAQIFQSFRDAIRAKTG